MLRKLYNSSIEIVFIDQTRTNKQEMFFLHFFCRSLLSHVMSQALSLFCGANQPKECVLQALQAHTHATRMVLPVKIFAAKYPGYG